MVEWIKHNGKGMPVDGDTPVYVRQRCGFESTRVAPAVFWKAGYDNWIRASKKFSGYDIIAYRIHKPAPAGAA
jgi:hypothetical protein